MDRRRFSAIAHADHLFGSPLDPAKAKRLVDLLDLPAGARVLDLGTGNAELLSWIVEKWGARGVGVEVSPPVLEQARARVAARGLADRIELREIDMADLREPAGSFDLVMNVGAIPTGGYRAMLRRMAELARPGGLLLAGEGYWKRVPDAAYLEALGATRDEYGDHAGNVAAAEEEGLQLLYASVSSDDEWDHYEGLYNRAVERFVAAHPDDPDAPAMAERIRAWRRTYLRWGRDTLGFALYLFRR